MAAAERDGENGEGCDSGIVPAPQNGYIPGAVDSVVSRTSVKSSME